MLEGGYISHSTEYCTGQSTNRTINYVMGVSVGIRSGTVKYYKKSKKYRKDLKYLKKQKNYL